MKASARLLAIALLVLGACRADAQDGLAEVDTMLPDSPVVDAAQIIDEASETALDLRLRDYWEEEATAIVVSTTSNLDGQTIEDYAREQFGEWGIGGAETNRGVLVLVAPAERKARIEVGCGLESVLTNPVAQTIMTDDIIPRFIDGDIEGGITAGVDGIIAALAASEAEPGPVSPYCVELMREAA